MFEIGYWVSNRYAGQGLITEAVNVLTQHAFSMWDATALKYAVTQKIQKNRP